MASLKMVLLGSGKGLLTACALGRETETAVSAFPVVVLVGVAFIFFFWVSCFRAQIFLGSFPCCRRWMGVPWGTAGGWVLHPSL